MSSGKSSALLPGCIRVLLLSVFVCSQGFAQSEPDVLGWWSFDENYGPFAYEKISQKKDSIYGNFERVPGIFGHGIKLDGFRTFIRRPALNWGDPESGFTLEAWLALASYPWSWSPVLDCSFERQKGFFFGINAKGQVGFKTGAGNTWYEATTDVSIQLKEWTHVAAVFEPGNRIRVFVNGKEEASLDIKGNFVPHLGGSMTIGRNKDAQVWHEPQFTTASAHFFLDGILDEIKISGSARTEKEISTEITALSELPVPALSRRDVLPRGPDGSGSFGAFYTRLNYYKEWDDLWRVSEVPDLFVRFDRSLVQMVFWRGTSFNPCWVTENDIWYTNEWLETWGSDVVSCAEPIMDRHCRYSHVRLIENTAARVVIHWRYALNDALYDFAAMSDDGRGEWCDEFHILYPDQVGIRKMELHYSHPERRHDWVEQIVVLPPGKYPGDVIEEKSISLVNMDGDVKAYTWDENLEIAMSEPRGANMSYVHLKSDYRPFFIVSPDSVETVEGNWDSPYIRSYAAHMASTDYRPDPAPTAYGWWNHWPVAQIPGDGRWVTTPDRPSHFNLTTFVQWNDYEYTDRTRTRIMLQGMTDKPAGDLLPLARSWLQAPEMTISSEGFTGGAYDRSERAYMIEQGDSGDGSPLSLVLEASADSPLVNPAIIIKNWGSWPATCFLNDKNLAEGEDFRQGIRRSLEGEDLILWFSIEEDKPVKIVLRK